MAGTEDSDSKRAWYNPGNLFDGLEILTGGEDKVTSATNIRAVIGWTAAACWILGDTVGTMLTRRGSGRLGLGNTVFIW